MKSTKKLLEIYAKAQAGDYYTSADFLADARAFIKDIRQHRVIAHIDPSRSGMSRKINFLRYNGLINICRKGKIGWEYVSVGGCGMDMYWYTMYLTCEDLLTKKEIDKWGINMACSHQSTL